MKGTCCTCRRRCPACRCPRRRELLQQTDRLIKTVPEVERVFGKAGRADTATDPAPLEMFETTIQFKPREQWRSGMTADKLVEELDRVVKVPGLSQRLGAAHPQPHRHAGHRHQVLRWASRWPGRTCPPSTD